MVDAIQVDALCGGYPNHTVFNGLSFRLSGSGLYTLIGPNGSGKSTLLKFLYREMKPASGKILLCGKDLADYPRKAIAEKLALVPQWGRIEYDFTVRDAVDMADGDTDAALRSCELEDKAEMSVLTLSGGEFQRTLIARALAQDTPILLFDEPVNNLDVAYQIATMHLLQKLVREQGKMVLLVLHDLTMAQVYSDTVLLLSQGELIAQGKAGDVITKSLIEQVYHAPMRWNEEEHILSPLW